MNFDDLDQFSTCHFRYAIALTNWLMKPCESIILDGKGNCFTCLLRLFIYEDLYIGVLTIGWTY